MNVLHDGRGCLVTISIPAEATTEYGEILRRRRGEPGPSVIPPIALLLRSKVEGKPAYNEIEEEIEPGTCLSFHVGGDESIEFVAYMARINAEHRFENPCYIIAGSENPEPVDITSSHVLTGEEVKHLKPGECMEINIATNQRWVLKSRHW